MTKAPAPGAEATSAHSYQYDAWNRLRRVFTDANSNGVYNDGTDVPPRRTSGTACTGGSSSGSGHYNSVTDAAFDVTMANIGLNGTLNNWNGYAVANVNGRVRILWAGGKLRLWEDGKVFDATIGGSSAEAAGEASIILYVYKVLGIQGKARWGLKAGARLGNRTGLDAGPVSASVILFEKLE